MKKLLIVLLVMGTALGASAQRIHGGGGRVVTPVHSRTVIVAAPVYAYSPFYPYYGFNSPFYRPFDPFYARPYRPSKLDLKIEDIRHDYQDKIKSARESLRGREKRETIRELKKERDQVIQDTRRNYYKS